MKQRIKETDLLEAKSRLETLSRIQTEARTEELKIREFLTDKLYPADKAEGSVTVTEHGMKVALTRVLNYNISKADADLMTQQHPELAAQALSWSPRVKTTGYKAHEDVLAEYVVVKAGPSTVTFK
jgi:hypothetical protein